MKNLKEYVKKDLGYVSRWWKWLFLSCIGVEIGVILTAASLAYQPTEDMPCMKEIYFDGGDTVYFVGWFNAE